MKIFKFPLKQHVGAPCVPVVKEGDNIKRGEKIAEPNGLGANIHSSVSGKVLKVNESEIHIEWNGELQKDFVKIKECNNIVDSVFEAGIVGAGGAGFPTHIKLKSELNDGYIIANCVECEPVLHHNVRLLEECPELILNGIKYAMEATKAKKAYIAIKRKNKKAIESISIALKKYSDIEIKELRDMYPMGEERAIIHEIFGVWLEPDKLPIEVKSVILNAETLKNIAEAVDNRKPVIDKDITIVGKIKNIENYEVLLNVPVGKSMKDIIEEHGGIDGNYGELIIGGPYTGKSENIENSVVTKISGGAIVTIELPEYDGPLGLLICACGANEERLRDVASKMKSKVVGVTKCKNAVDVRGTDKCLTPGECPGQVQGIMKLKKDGAKRVLISNCSDCSNTVMCCAPQLGLGVYHHTDHVFRTVDYPLTRRLPMDDN